MRKGDYRNHYKGPWTKSRGSVDVGEGGGFNWDGEKRHTTVIEYE